MALSASDIDAAYQPTKVRASVCLDSDLVLEIQRLEEKMRAEDSIDKRTNRTPVAPAIAAQVVELRDQAAAAEVEFVFAGVGRRVYTDLRKAHPPTDEHKKAAEDVGQAIEFNPDTFPPALMAASCLEPEGTTEAWWARKYDEWTVGQLERLWRACLAAQGGVVEVPKVLDASAMTTDSEWKRN